MIALATGARNIGALVLTRPSPRRPAISPTRRDRSPSAEQDRSKIFPITGSRDALSRRCANELVRARTVENFNGVEDVPSGEVPLRTTGVGRQRSSRARPFSKNGKGHCCRGCAEIEHVAQRRECRNSGEKKFLSIDRLFVDSCLLGNQQKLPVQLGRDFNNVVSQRYDFSRIR